MTEMLEQQSTAFAVCVLFGAGIGLIIGLFNAFKKVINIKGTWIGFIDLLFWLVLCATVIWTTNYILCELKKGLRKVIFRAKKLVDIICSRR